MNARARVPRLRPPGDCPNFKMPETQTTQPFDRDSVFIVPGGEADRILELQPKRLDLQTRIIHFKDGSKPRGRDWKSPGPFYQPQRQRVRLFRIKPVEERTEFGVHE